MKMGITNGMNKVTFDDMYDYWRVATPETQNDVIRLLKGEGKLKIQETEMVKFPELYTMAEVITITHRSRATINRAVKSGKLEKIQLNGEGSHIQFKGEDIYNWIEGCKTGKSVKNEKGGRRRI